MCAQVQRCPGYRDISNPTCVLLDHAHKELQVRIQEVEYRHDLWGSGAALVSDARKSYDCLRQALKTHYQIQHEHWPPRECQEKNGGLTRLLVEQLQNDLASLYYAYVDCNREALSLSTRI